MKNNDEVFDFNLSNVNKIRPKNINKVDVRSLLNKVIIYIKRVNQKN